MKEKSILICDTDPAYLKAFHLYLMGELTGVRIVSYWDYEEFLREEENFTIGIISKEFLEVVEEQNLCQHIFCLCGQQQEEIAYPCVYKYQSMDIVVEMIMRLEQKEIKTTEKTVLKKSIKQQILGIYSPIHHELQLPFALAIAQQLRKKGRVLFLDGEEISILPELIHQKELPSLLDYLYVLTQEDHHLLTSYIHSYMGVDYVPPSQNPEDLSNVTYQHWLDLFRSFSQLEYDYIVVLFGKACVEFHKILTVCEQVMILNKPGDFYQKSQRVFLEYAMENGIQENLLTVSLPMSAGNLCDGNYLLEELIQGNLGQYVQRELSEKILQKQGIC